MCSYSGKNDKTKLYLKFQSDEIVTIKLQDGFK